MHMCTYVYVCIYACMCMCIFCMSVLFVCVCVLYVYVRTCVCGGACVCMDASMPDLTHVCMHAYVHVCVLHSTRYLPMFIMYVNPIPFHPVWLSSAATKVHPSGGGREWQHVPLQQLRQETGAHAAGSADGDGSLRKA